MDARHDPPWWRQRFWLVLMGVMAVGGLLLLTEHRAHVLGVLPFVLLLICPMMHLFMRHGHGHQEHRDDVVADDGPHNMAEVVMHDNVSASGLWSTGSKCSIGPHGEMHPPASKT